MFILYAVPVGLLLGFVLAGQTAGLAVAGLARVRIRWAALAVTGLVAQIILFAAPVSDRIGDAGPPIYVLSTAAVFVVVLRNLAIRGMSVVAIGAGCNLLAIGANGGYMPAGSAAVASIGRSQIATYSNSVVIESPMLEPLTDVIAMPSWIPFTNIVSIGDLLIGVGIAAIIVLAMRTSLPARVVPAGNSPD
ncbi:MAG: DUF5317 family protein [Candidatus Limnocylindrales bacterium]